MTSRAARRGRRRRAKQVRRARDEAEAEARRMGLRSPAYKERYLTHPDPTCPVCGVPSTAVEIRIDPYYQALSSDGVWPYRSCIPCWRQRYYDS